MEHSAEMLRCMRDLDVAGIRKLSAHISPHQPQPKSDAEALISLHMARTQSPALEFRLRAYSHSWLSERGYPSQLPDRLKPKAERMYPRIVEAVGIACGGTSELGRAIAPYIQKAMQDCVLDAYADGKMKSPEYIKGLMLNARTKTVQELLGRARERK